MRVLLVGGSKSGKSMLAQELCRVLGGSLYYWATMAPVDDEDRARIARHQEERRDWGFTTVERGRDLRGAVSQIDPTGTVLFDSVTAALANEMFSAPEPDETAWQRVRDNLLHISRHSAHFVCVCDDLWRDGGDYDRWTEAYCRGLALICRALAEGSDVVCEVAAGRPHLWKGALPR